MVQAAVGGQQDGGVSLFGGDVSVLIDFEADEGVLERYVGIHGGGDVGKSSVERARQVSDSTPLRSSKG